MIVTCVLRSGGPYTAEWVHALKRGLARHLPGEWGWRVLTDQPDSFGPWGVRLQYDWPRWWPKLELFRPGVFPAGEQVLYLDLDTLVVGDLTELAAHRTPLALISDFYTPDLAESGVMSFTPGPHTERIWEAFVRNPHHAMALFRMDGRYIRAHAEDAERLDRRFPGQIVSLKVHGRAACPPGARLVCAHGRPKFDAPDAPAWAREEWQRL